jgi:hypothetical protein
MRILLCGLFLLLGTACSSLHIDKGYYVERGELAPNVKPLCEHSGDFGDEVFVRYSESGTLEMNVRPDAGFALIGIPLVPFFPSHFSDSIDELDVHMQARRPVLYSSKATLKVRLDDGDWITSEWTPPMFTIKLGKSQSPQKVDVQFDGLTLDGKPLPALKITFYRRGVWHYVPLMMDSEPHNVPCAPST